MRVSIYSHTVLKFTENLSVKYVTIKKFTELFLLSVNFPSNQLILKNKF